MQQNEISTLFSPKTTLCKSDRVGGSKDTEENGWFYLIFGLLSTSQSGRVDALRLREKRYRISAKQKNQLSNPVSHQEQKYTHPAGFRNLPNHYTIAFCVLSYVLLLPIYSSKINSTKGTHSTDEVKRKKAFLNQRQRESQRASHITEVKKQHPSFSEARYSNFNIIDHDYIRDSVDCVEQSPIMSRAAFYQDHGHTFESKEDGNVVEYAVYFVINVLIRANNLRKCSQRTCINHSRHTPCSTH